MPPATRTYRTPPEVAGSRRHGWVASPLGDILLSAEGGRLVGLELRDRSDGLLEERGVDRYGKGPHGESPEGYGPGDVLERASEEVRAYFAGALTRFQVPLAPRGSPFELAVWKALEQIPYGQTASYGEVAAWIGRPSGARAVGGAVGRNPICLVVPCHRVIGADGTLTGFGWGLDRKRWLLAHEQTGKPPSR